MTAFCLALPLALSGCGSLFDEGAAASAGVAGAAVAGSISHSAAVTSGIGLGALAAAQSGAKYVEKRAHGKEQDAIAGAAGPLAAGQVASWRYSPLIKLEPAEHGRVTVNRVIAAAALQCKEIVFSVDTVIHHAQTSPGTDVTQQPGIGGYDDPAFGVHQVPRDQAQNRDEPVSAFYVATICLDGKQWRWASAEPATERWGALQ